MRQYLTVQLDQPPVPNMWIITRNGLGLVCPNGCCMHRAFVSGDDVPAPGEWRPATDAEIDAGEAAVNWSVEGGDMLASMEAVEV